MQISLGSIVRQDPWSEPGSEVLIISDATVRRTGANFRNYKFFRYGDLITAKHITASFYVTEPSSTEKIDKTVLWDWKKPMPKKDGVYGRTYDIIVCRSMICPCDADPETRENVVTTCGGLTLPLTERGSLSPLIQETVVVLRRVQKLLSAVGKAYFTNSQMQKKFHEPWRERTWPIWKSILDDSRIPYEISDKGKAFDGFIIRKR